MPQIAYNEAANQRVAAALLDAVSRATASGHGVIVDASFRQPSLRRAVAQRVRAAGRHFAGLWLEAPLPVLERRVAARRDDASDADLGVLRAAARASTGPNLMAAAGRNRDRHPGGDGKTDFRANSACDG